MKPSSLPKKLPSSARPYLGMGIFAFGFALALSSSGLELNQLLDPRAAAVIWGTTILPAAFLSRQKVPHGKSLLVLSIPAGIICCVVGMHALLHLGDRELSGIGANSATMLLTVLYSTLIAFLGYMFDHQDKNCSTMLSVKIILVPVLLSVGTLYWIANGLAESNLVSVTTYFDAEIFLFFIAFFAALTLKNDHREFASNLADASIFGMIILIVISLLIWFASMPSSEVPRNATEIATQGILYGTFLYMLSFYLSLVTGENDEINFGIKNWHLIEITALYILLVFAPPSIFELAL